jgi:hypothetical protein
MFTESGKEFPEVSVNPKKCLGTLCSSTGRTIVWGGRTIKRYQISENDFTQVGEVAFEHQTIIGSVIVGNRFFVSVRQTDGNQQVLAADWSGSRADLKPFRNGRIASTSSGVLQVLAIEDGDGLHFVDAESSKTIADLRQNIAQVFFDVDTNLLLIHEHDCTDLYFFGGIFGDKVKFVNKVYHPGSVCDQATIRDGIAAFRSIGRRGSDWSSAICKVDLIGKRGNKLISLANAIDPNFQVDCLKLTPDLSHVLMLCRGSIYSCSFETGEISPIKYDGNSSLSWFDILPQERLLVGLTANGELITVAHELSRGNSSTVVNEDLFTEFDIDLASLSVEELWTAR